MELTHIEHIGIAVKSLETAIPYYEEKLGLKCYAIEEVADQKVKTAFLKVGEVKIELLEPTCPESTIQKFLDNGGRGIHHIAFKVEDGVSEALALCDIRSFCFLSVFADADEYHIRRCNRNFRIPCIQTCTQGINRMYAYNCFDIGTARIRACILC